MFRFMAQLGMLKYFSVLFYAIEMFGVWNKNSLTKVVILERALEHFNSKLKSLPTFEISLNGCSRCTTSEIIILIT